MDQKKKQTLALIVVFGVAITSIVANQSNKSTTAKRNTPLVCAPDSALGGQTSCVASLQINPTPQVMPTNGSQHEWSWATTASMLFGFYGYKIAPQLIQAGGTEDFQKVVTGEPGNFSSALDSVSTDNNGRTFSSKIIEYDELNSVGDLTEGTIPSDLINNEPVILDVGGNASLLISLRYLPAAGIDTSMAAKILSATVIDPISGLEKVLLSNNTAHSATVWKISPIANSYSLNPVKVTTMNTEQQDADIFCNVLRDIVSNLATNPKNIELSTPSQNNMSDVLPNFSACTLYPETRSAICTKNDGYSEAAASNYQGSQSFVQSYCLTNYIPTDTSDQTTWRITFASPSNPNDSVQILYYIGGNQIFFKFKY
jgi:hypothetical protein